MGEHGCDDEDEDEDDDGDEDDEGDDDHDNTPSMIPLNVIAQRVYANLGNGGTVDLDTFLSTLRTEFELASGQEWKDTLLNAARRMFSHLVNTVTTARIEETDKEEIIPDVSCHSGEDQVQDEDEDQVQ